jgi:hypothetical protein
MLHRIERFNYLFGGLLVIAVAFTTRAIRPARRRRRPHLLNFAFRRLLPRPRRQAGDSAAAPASTILPR